MVNIRLFQMVIRRLVDIMQPRSPFLRKVKQLLLSICLTMLAFLSVTWVIPATAQHRAVNQIQVSESMPSLMEQGRVLYETGQFSAAVPLWKQVADGYAAKGDRLNQALSLSYLSLTYQQLGQLPEAEAAIATSLALIQAFPSKHSSTNLVLAQVLNSQGSLQLAKGQTEVALETWKQAEVAYTKAGDELGVLGSQINQSQALQTLGLYRRAKTVLEAVNQKLQAQPDSPLKATGLRSLGVALQVVGDLRQSQKFLEQSLAMIQSLQGAGGDGENRYRKELSATLLSLGNTARALQDSQAALGYYQRITQLFECKDSAENCTSNLTYFQGLINQFSLYIDTQQLTEAQAVLPQIQEQLKGLPLNRSSIYAQVNFAQNLMKLDLGRQNSQNVAQLLAQAIQGAKQLGDAKAESYALGELGQLYEEAGQWSDAQTMTQQALLIAQGINADNIAARWQWQLGRIYKQQQKIPKAIVAYSEAVNTLQSLRSDLVAINQDVQFSFRESVEPVYREFVALLLDANPSQDNLKQARKLIEALQLAELDNFFREACLDVKPQQIDEVDPQAAVIYPIILADRLAVIFSVSGQPLRYAETKLPKNQLETTLDEMLQSLNPAFSKQERLRLSQQVYSWMIQPFTADLERKQTKTLVFVLDGILRNLPMAALYDGKQYLVEKYSIAVTPGLQLLETNTLGRRQIKALTAGLTDARQGFSALPAVKSEINQIASEIPSQILLDREFSESNLQEQIKQNSFPIVHLATHGQFSSNPEQTFILTWDQKINVKEFETLLRGSSAPGELKPIELLVLSACQTAAGDNRAALGLAGVAVRSGASSTLATLWSVRDESTATLMAEFYRELAQPKISKAEALRQAQLALLKQSRYEHPFYWAPFVLVGNWL